MRIDPIGNNFIYHSVRDIPRVSQEEVRRQDESRQLAQSIGVAEKPMQVSEEMSPKDPKIGDLGEAAMSFSAERDFTVIGRDSDLYKLDMEKAISDMKKDGILQEYQYFVRSAGLV